MNFDETGHLGHDAIFTRWRKSSRSNPNGNQCVEVSFSHNAVGLRDSKSPHSGVLAFDHREWASFLAGLAAGEFRTQQTE